MDNSNHATPRTEDKPNTHAKTQHEPLRHSEMYVSLLLSLVVSLLG
jgi:hypothetical protein